MDTKVYFQGVGLVTAIGDTVAETASAARGSMSKPSDIFIEQAEGNVHLPYFTIGTSDINTDSDRIFSIIDSVIDQALSDAGIEPEQLKRAGVFLGSTSFDMCQSEMAIKATERTDHDIAENTPSFTELGHYIQQRFSISGPMYIFNTACTSSANALMYAADFIRAGNIEHALVLGLEFYNEVTALGFSSLELISRDGMRPFDPERDGLYLGEGCGALILSSQPADKGFEFIAGDSYGENYSITASNPDGEAVKKVINGALQQAGITSDKIAIVKAHGTASLSNDDAEFAGLRSAFSESIPPIVSLKPIIGHTLGACGINELILFLHSLKNQNIITYSSDVNQHADLSFAVDEDIPPKGFYLLNYFGFGGNNTALVIANA